MKHDAWRTPSAPTSPIPRLALSVRELAESLGVSERTVAGWTASGEGPPSLTMGRLRLYPVAAVQTWLLARADAESAEQSTEP